MYNSESKIKIDNVVRYILLVIAFLCASTIIFVIAFILVKGISPFLLKYPTSYGYLKANLMTFLTSTSWIKLNAAYGALGALINTIYVTFLATIIALPISVLTALFIVRIAPKAVSVFVNNVVELLAAIPSIIFGLFGSGIINPIVKNIANFFNVQTFGGTSVLSTVLVLTIMMIPTITMLSVTSMKAVKDSQIQASLALGASYTQTNFKVVLNGAKSGIFAALILGVGRALGEATAVSMVCGNATKGPNFGLFDITRTLTSTMMLEMHESSGIDYDIRFSAGILLIIVIIITNVILNTIKKRMEKYSNA